MTNLFDLTGNVAVVTGGNRGIGLGMAEGLAAAGASLCLWGRDAERNAAAAEQLRAHGGEVHVIGCDVSDEENVRLAFEETLAVFGKVDSCFANAGVGAGSTRFEDMTTDEWRRILSINLDGVFFTFREAARHMKERGEGGSLVGTASVAALRGMPRGEHYSASKAGITGLVRSLAVEYGRYGIRANSVLPGWVYSEMSAPVTKGERQAPIMLARTPAGRFGEPSDFAGIAVYLASPASVWHTGDQMIIDGGYSKA
jgi:NAD(P)-dependent dehydrogenase (short-subunit alcohol dehydrogenase family)